MCVLFRIQMEYLYDRTLNSTSTNQTAMVLYEPVHVATLEIIAKSKMNGVFCYLGLNRESSRILRPVKLSFRKDAVMPIDSVLQVGHIYNFAYKASDQQYLTQLPHAKEDLAVINIEHVNIGPWSAKEWLLGIAANDIELCTYVDEGTPCSSVRIMKCNPRHLQIYKYKYSFRIKLQGMLYHYDLPYTAIDTPNLANERDVVAIMSMGRPFDSNGRFNPRRCYILVVGLM